MSARSKNFERKKIFIQYALQNALFRSFLFDVVVELCLFKINVRTCLNFEKFLNFVSLKLKNERCDVYVRLFVCVRTFVYCKNNVNTNMYVFLFT